MNIQECTKEYETWLHQRLQDFEEFDSDAFEQALAKKHKDMKDDGEHAFLRGTFYRWAQQWVDGEMKDAGVVIPVVGDTHVENFGTWRDAEGRLVWGVNDFDEACELPWTSDLVRLGVSAGLALVKIGNLNLSADDVCDAIHTGYKGVFDSQSPAPMVLQEDNDALRKLAWKLVLGESPKKWWQDEQEKLRELLHPPPEALAALQKGLPLGCTNVTTFERQGKAPGMGSRGKPRYYASANWQGARILREAKAILPSALEWAKKGDNSGLGLKEMLKLTVRCLDPFHTIHGRWVVRRLAPDSSKIELKDIDKAGASAEEKRDLFKSMGAELANLHLGTASLQTVGKDDELRRDVGEWSKELFRARVGEWTKKVISDYKKF